MGKALVIITLGLASADCGEGRDAEARFTVRDSVGIPIVENDGPTWREGEGWRLVSTPEVQIGSRNIEGSELFQVRDAASLSDGRIVVANGGTGEILFFGPGGRFLLAAGGEGGGPGEFRSPSRLMRLPGDSILVWDPRERRFSVFAPDGSFARSFQVEASGMGIPEVGGRYPDGSLLVSVRLGFALRDGPPRPGPCQDTLTLLRYAPDKAALDTLLLVPGREVIVRSQRDAVMFVRPPLFPEPQVILGGARLFVGFPDRWEVREHAGDGRLVRAIRCPHEPRAVTPELVDAVIEERVAGIDEDEAQRQVREGYRAMPLPETLPAFGAMKVDPAGHLWVQRYAPLESTETLWDVFDPEGRWLGPVRMPPRFRPFRVGDESVLGLGRDELDLEYVRVYRIEKG